MSTTATVASRVHLPAEQTMPDLRNVIESAITNDPRTLQTTLGPSEIGTECTRCLIHMLAGHQKQEHVAPWLPTIGHAVHAWLEQAPWAWMVANQTMDDRRYHTERKVTVGQVAGEPIKGTLDLYDAFTGTVVDYKISGKPKLDEVRRKGPSPTYQRQGQLYGKGLQDEGEDVRSVAIYFLPRNAVSLQHAQTWQVPYDRSVAQAALDRATTFAGFIQAAGVEAVLAASKAHTGDEFSCGRFVGDDPVNAWGKPITLIDPSDPFGS